jgi:hypothetical protein
MAVDLQQQVAQLEAALATEKAKVGLLHGIAVLSSWPVRSPSTFAFARPQVDERELAYNAAAQVQSADSIGSILSPNVLSDLK